jgi:hypothetical protein
MRNARIRNEYLLDQHNNPDATDMLFNEIDRKYTLKTLINRREQEKKYRANNKEKFRAKAIVRYYLLNGTIKKPAKCSMCNISHCRLHAHHPNYLLPLNVIWVCPKCHKEIHKDNES